MSEQRSYKSCGAHLVYMREVLSSLISRLCILVKNNIPGEKCDKIWVGHLYREGPRSHSGRRTLAHGRD